MLLRSKLWVTVGLLCASMTARAEYKEVWNPPEAPHDAQRARHAAAGSNAANGSKASNTAPPGTHASHIKAAKRVDQSGAKAKARRATGAVVKTAHAPVLCEPSRKPSHARPSAAAAKPRQMADNRASQAGSGPASRELPPIVR